MSRIISNELLLNISETNHIRTLVYDPWLQEIALPSKYYQRPIGVVSEFIKQLSLRSVDFLFASDGQWNWRQSLSVYKPIITKCIELELCSYGTEIEFSFDDVVSDTPDIRSFSGHTTAQFRLVKQKVGTNTIFVFYKLMGSVYSYLFHIIPIFSLAPPPIVIDVSDSTYSKIVEQFINANQPLTTERNRLVDDPNDIVPWSAINDYFSKAGMHIAFDNIIKKLTSGSSIWFNSSHSELVSSVLDSLDTVRSSSDINIDRHITPITFRKKFYYLIEIEELLKRVLDIITNKRGEVNVKVN